MEFVPGGERLIARGQVRQLEFSVAPGDRLVGIFHDRKGALHPRMEVALHGDEIQGAHTHPQWVALRAVAIYSIRDCSTPADGCPANGAIRCCHDLVNLVSTFVRTFEGNLRKLK